MSAGLLDVDRARGLLLGLLLGDAGAHRAGAARVAGERGVLFPTAASRLACFTVDGLIRGHLRMAHRGIGPPELWPRRRLVTGHSGIAEASAARVKARCQALVR